MNKHFQQLLPLYMVIFVSFLGYATTVALFVPMIMQKSSVFVPVAASTSYRASLVGFLITVYPLGQFFGAPVLGSLADRFGRKKVLTVSLFLACIGYFFIALSLSMRHLPLLFISLFFTGLCEANMAIAQSAAVDITTVEERGKLIGYMYVMCSLGYIVGPLIGGVLAYFFSYALPFWLTLCLLIATLLWIKKSFTDTYVPNTNKESILKAFTNLKTVITDKKLKSNYLANFLIFFAIFGFYRCYLIYMTEKWSLGVLAATAIYSIASLLCMLANMFVNGPLLKKIGYYYATIFTVGMGGVLFIATIIPSSLSGFVVIVGIAAFISVMGFSACTALLSSLANIKSQGQVLGNNQALQVLGESASAALGGLIAAVSISLSLVSMGILALLAAYLIFKRKDMNSQHQQVSVKETS